MNHNPLHYPTLYRCKKLTELGFPETQHWYFKEKDNTEFLFTTNYWETNNQWYDRYVCPSVMEMVNVIPKDIFWDIYPDLETNKFIVDIYYKINFHSISSDTLPNALADTIIWLVENNLLSFNKKSWNQK